MTEEALVFGPGGTSVGILTEPLEARPGLPAVLLLNSGLIHRPGPNRLYVRLARRLAALGLPAFRFDFSGIGDSETRPSSLPFVTRWVAETREAMDHVSAVRGVERFVLMGVCSGAVISFKTACRDPRVVGAALINGQGWLEEGDGEVAPAVRERTLARHYRRMTFGSSFARKNWRKALRGRVDYRGILRVALRAPLRRLVPRPRAAAAGPAAGSGAHFLEELAARHLRLLVLHCEGDEGLDYTHLVLGGQLARWRTDGPLRLVVIPGANHTFTLLWCQEECVRIIAEWAQASWT